MFSDKSDPNIVKHTPRVSALKEIDCRATYNLGKSFRNILESQKTSIEASLGKKLWLKSSDLHSVFLDLALIISRINEDGTKVNRREELFEIIHDRHWTDEEEREYENLGFGVNCLLFDVKSLLINITIYMDVLAKFLSLCIKSNRQPRNRSFERFRKDLKNYRGPEIEVLKRIVNEYATWYDEIKNLRDDFIIHHPAGRHALEFFDGIAHIPLTTTKKEYNHGHIIDGAIAKSLSIEKIDSTLSQLKILLTELNKYLTEKINAIPFKAEYYEP